VSPSQEKIVRLEKKSLRRVLKTVDLFSVGFGDVGSSLYYALGATAFFALGATPIALLIAGFVFVCTALTYAEMGATFPEPGGAAVYARYAFNDLISFIAGWGLLFDYILTIAISAFAILPYLNNFLHVLGLHYTLTPVVHCSFTVGLIILLFFLNFFGVHKSGRLSSILAIFTIVLQIGIILIGMLTAIHLPEIIHQMKIGVIGVNWSPNWSQFAIGCAMAMVAYTGIEAISQLAAETKNPGITIPRAIKWTITVVLFLYFGISIVGFSVVTPMELGTTYLNNPVGGIAEHLPIGGAFFGPLIGLLATTILFVSANAGLLGCSRLVFSMGEFYQVPSFCYKIHPRFQTPYVTLIIFTIIASGVVILSQGQMIFLADLYNFGAQIAFVSVHASLLVLRWKKPELNRPYRAPFNISFGKKRFIPLTAVIGVFATFSIWLLVVVTKPAARYVGTVWVLFGLCMYFYYRKIKKISPLARSEIEKIDFPQYHAKSLHHILFISRTDGGIQALETACQLAKFHSARLTIAHVEEVPESLPIKTPIVKAESLAETSLKRAEAIARELHVSPHLKLIHSRSLRSALIELNSKNRFDLVVIGIESEEFSKPIQQILEDLQCSVLLYRS